MTSRRAFLTTALRATVAGVLVPEWLLDPLKGRSMVTVPGLPLWQSPEFQMLHPCREFVFDDVVKFQYGVRGASTATAASIVQENLQTRFRLQALQGESLRATEIAEAQRVSCAAGNSF